MNPRHLAALFTLMLIVPFAPLADAGEGKGHCKNPHRDEHTHEHCTSDIPDTFVGPGQKVVYRGHYRAVGTVTIAAGGQVDVTQATIRFEDTSSGFRAQPGATLIVDGSALTEANSSSFEIQAPAGSNFVLTGSQITGGSGVKIGATNASVSGNTLQGIPVAIALSQTSITIEHNTFIGNVVSVNQTGGSPRLENNTFQGGQFCVRDWLSDPVIVNNVFRGCHVGIYHEQSESILSQNDMMDEAEPPGVGIWILNTHSPIVEGNNIRNYGTGIRITDARAYVRNNTITGNVGAGVWVERNSDVMDIQGNLIANNGGDGIHMDNVTNVPVTNNVVENNGGRGIVIMNTPSAFVQGNTVRGNAGTGILLVNSPGALIEQDEVSSNAAGIVLDAQSADARLFANTVTTNVGHGVVVGAGGANITGGSFSGNGGHGLKLDRALGVVIASLTANGNAQDGVFMGGSRATVTNVNASANGGNGFTFDPMGPLTLLGQTPLSYVRAFGNGGSGLLNIQGNATSVNNAWWQSNGIAGVKNNDLAAVIDATQCYWGSASGPRNAANPLGTGDAAQGSVVFVPFRTAPPQ